jgi:hypothetical protein
VGLAASVGRAFAGCRRKWGGSINGMVRERKGKRMLPCLESFVHAAKPFLFGCVQRFGKVYVTAVLYFLSVCIATRSSASIRPHGKKRTSRFPSKPLSMHTHDSKSPGPHGTIQAILANLASRLAQARRPGRAVKVVRARSSVPCATSVGYFSRAIRLHVAISYNNSPPKGRRWCSLVNTPRTAR